MDRARIPLLRQKLASVKQQRGVGRSASAGSRAREDQLSPLSRARESQVSVYDF